MNAQMYVLNKGHPGRAAVLARAHAFLDRLPNTDTWEIEVRRHKPKRTPKQRSALFAAAYGPIMEFMGLRGEQDKKDLHAFWCGEFWGWHPVLKNKPLRTTTKNERGERDEIDIRTALDFYAFIQQQSAENGIDVPEPDPFWRESREAA